MNLTGCLANSFFKTQCKFVARRLQHRHPPSANLPHNLVETVVFLTETLRSGKLNYMILYCCFTSGCQAEGQGALERKLA